MKNLLVVCMVAGCWTSSQPASESSTPAPVAAKSTGGNAYGGAAYGGDGYGGVLGSTALQQGGAFASLTGTDDISSGFDQEIYGGLLGDSGEGGGGLGTVGSGAGGGGAGWGTIGTGRYGTIGNGSGTGYGNGALRPSPRLATVTIGQPTVTGDLDKAIIRRYIKRNFQKLHYCYEKELLMTPGIDGTLTVTFTITVGTGLVASAAAKGVHANVEACVATVIKSIEFPRPKGDKDVRVVYPFTFAPAP